MANSSWTQAHIGKLWGSCPHLVHPPVDTASLQVRALTQAPWRQPLLLLPHGQAIKDTQVCLCYRAWAGGGVALLPFPAPGSYTRPPWFPKPPKNARGSSRLAFASPLFSPYFATR